MRRWRFMGFASLVSAVVLACGVSVLAASNTAASDVIVNFGASGAASMLSNGAGMTSTIETSHVYTGETAGLEQVFAGAQYAGGGWPNPAPPSQGTTFITLPGPVNLSTRSSLDFWIYDTEGNNTYYVTLYDTKGDRVSAWTQRGTKDTWYQVVLPLNAATFNNNPSGTLDFAEVDKIGIGQWWPGTYYISSITAPLAATSTAASSTTAATTSSKVTSSTTPSTVTSTTTKATTSSSTAKTTSSTSTGSSASKTTLPRTGSGPLPYVLGALLILTGAIGIRSSRRIENIS